MAEKREAQAGDIVFVDRGLYRHFAVYIGDGKVIHYAPPGNHLKFCSDEAYIHEAPLGEFLGDNTQYGICEFSDPLAAGTLEDELWDLFHVVLRAVTESKKKKKRKSKKAEELYHLYTPEETVARAKERIGERNYDLVENNCEHFALWCKTGISESRQVNRILDCVKTIDLVADLLK